ncbi:D-galactarate dehydratase [Poseidonocella pacifica]|nr:D-galactarate dehydratase [Poseidonocella pacifica]
MNRYLWLTLPLILSSCTAAMTPQTAVMPRAEMPKSDVPPPPETARTVAEYDTTSSEQRAKAKAGGGGATSLGRTIASLGSPSVPGIWMKTPLVSSIQQGAVLYPQTGERVRLELRPAGTEAGAGSQLSLAAMRLLGAPLTGLPEVEVFAD